MNCHDPRGLVAVHARGDVDERQLAHQLGRLARQQRSREAAERHADHERAVGGQHPHRRGDVRGVQPRPERALVAVGPSGRAPVGRWRRAGGPGRGPRCPRCARSARRRGAAPGRAGRHPRRARSGVDRPGSPPPTAPHRRRPVPGDPELVGVLAEQPELVVRDWDDARQSNAVAVLPTRAPECRGVPATAGEEWPHAVGPAHRCRPRRREGTRMRSNATEAPSPPVRPAHGPPRARRPGRARRGACGGGRRSSGGVGDQNAGGTRTVRPRHRVRRAATQRGTGDATAVALTGLPEASTTMGRRRPPR